jgi:ribonucleoside-triphosphate reductase
MEKCVVCGKELAAKEGFLSSTGALACSKECVDQHMQTLPNNGKAGLVHYSRVTGYYTPIESWNKGKMAEFRDRQRYSTFGE